MDWSLGDPYAKHPFLRPTLGYKKVWMYYVAMVIDPILRFNWILYAVIPLQLQHSAVTSFVVAISEVCRRGMWTLFRVENEHCTNVGRFRASRDIPLPYDVPSPEISARESVEQRNRQQPAVADHEVQRVRTYGTTETNRLTPHPSRTSGDAEQGATRTGSSTRRRAATYTTHPNDQESPLVRGLSRVGTLLRDAHAQDFERRKKPELGGRADGKIDYDSDDEDEDADGEESEHHSRGSDEDEVDERDEEDVRRVREEVAIGRGESNGESGLRGGAV